MTLDIDLERLQVVLSPLSALLRKPEPGVAHWQWILRSKAVALRNLLLELYPLDADASQEPPRIAEHAGDPPKPTLTIPGPDDVLPQIKPSEYALALAMRECHGNAPLTAIAGYGHVTIEVQHVLATLDALAREDDRETLAVHYRERILRPQASTR